MKENKSKREGLAMQHQLDAAVTPRQVSFKKRSIKRQGKTLYLFKN